MNVVHGRERVESAEFSKTSNIKEELMRFPRRWYPIHSTIGEYLDHLTPAQQKGLATWVLGAILAESACQNAVIAALCVRARWYTLRQYLREWLYDGKDRAAPCNTQVEVERCFRPLMRWIVGWWEGNELPLALDVTLKRDRFAAIVVSVLYRGSAIPVAWAILPANQEGAWMPHICSILERLRPGIPKHKKVLVLTDRGLWSPRLWKQLKKLGFHPIMRVRQETTFQPDGGTRQKALYLVAGPGCAWVGTGTAFKSGKKQHGTLLVVWGCGQEEPWLILTDLGPEQVGVSWYGLRMWIEVGFRAIKSMGWRWEHTRRSDPERVSRHFLVLAVASIWVMGYGTRVEDKGIAGLPPVLVMGGRRIASLFLLGTSFLRWALMCGPVWRRLKLRPDPLPGPPEGVHITYHCPGLPHAPP